MKPNETKNERTSNLRALIVGGDDAAKARHPCCVSLVNGGLNHPCGGSLIVSNVALLAAHCAGGGLRWAIVGRCERSLDGEDCERIEIARQHVNPDFDLQDLVFDQMILKLSRPSTMPIVTLNFDPDIPEMAGENLTVIGSGRTDDQGPASEVLQQVTVDHNMDNTQCGKAKRGNLSHDKEISPDVPRVCDGDSGEWACPIELRKSNRNADAVADLLH
jgi:hypothetical protein